MLENFIWFRRMENRTALDDVLMGDETPIQDVDTGDDDGGDDTNQSQSVASNLVVRGGNKKAPSPAWSGMTKIQKTLEDGSVYPYAQCNTCKREFPAHPKTNGTTGLMIHLGKCPGSPLYKDPSDSQPILSQDTFGNPITYKFDQKVGDKNVLEWVILAEQSFMAVEHPAFRKMVLYFQPRYKMPNRKSIARDLLNLFYMEKARMKKGLTGLRVSLTTDTWTSIQNINYMAVTAHFLDNDWKLHKRILSFVKITSHRGEDLGKVLDGCLIDWGINNVFSITVDNASANDTMIEYMKRRLISRESLLLGGTYLHMRCACHILNLIVRDGLKEMSSAVEGIRGCVKYIHSSPSRLDTFREFAKLENLDPMATVPMDVVTRWNSTFKMLNAAHKYKSVFSRMAENDHNFQQYFLEIVSREQNGRRVQVKREGPPSDEDWKKSKSFVHFLLKFFDATKKLSAVKTPTVHIMLTIVLAVQQCITAALNDDSDEVLQNVATSMKVKFDKYWGSVADVCSVVLVAQVLDPVLKMDMIPILLGGIGFDKATIDETKRKTKDALNELYKHYKEGSGVRQARVLSGSGTTSTTIGSTSSNEGIQSDDLMGNAYRQLMEMRRATQTEEITNEVDKYFNDPVESQSNASFNLLDWWKLNGDKYPTLSKIAKDILAIPCSSVASESAFSLGGRVVDPFRASLTPRTVQALICTSDWLNGEDFDFDSEPCEVMAEYYRTLEELEKDVDTEPCLEEETPSVAASSNLDNQTLRAPSSLAPRPPQIPRPRARGGRAARASNSGRKRARS